MTKVDVGETRKSRQIQVIALTALINLMIGFAAGEVVFSPLSIFTPVSLPLDKLTIIDDIDAERSQAVVSINSDHSKNDLYSSVPVAPIRDPEIQRGIRQSIEMNELLCRQYKQDCEFAKTIRQQYEETYGR